MMPDIENVIKCLEACTGEFDDCAGHACPYWDFDDSKVDWGCRTQMELDALALLKEQEKKQITLHKKHVITWGRNDEFNMRKLYEAVCETLLDEGELFIARTDDHEKVDFVFYVTEGR